MTTNFKPRRLEFAMARLVTSSLMDASRQLAPSRMQVQSQPPARSLIADQGATKSTLPTPPVFRLAEWGSLSSEELMTGSRTCRAAAEQCYAQGNREMGNIYHWRANLLYNLATGQLKLTS